MTGRDPGTTYVVKIKSCNGSDGESSCSAWSSNHRVTTNAVEVNTGARPIVLDPITPNCPYTTKTKTAWGKPQNLDVTPHEGREITLCWTPVTGADGYSVSAKHEPTTGSPNFRTIETISNGSTSHLVVHLDDIYSRTPKVGLGNHRAFGLKVTATQTSSSVTHESDMIIIIDTPITEADGKSTSGEGNGKVLVEWNSVGDILGDAYSQGEYDLRHRKSLAIYNAYSPRISNFFESTGDPAENKASPFAIRNLATNVVYAIQLVYRAEGPSATTADDDIWVFAARDAYAWVSDEPIPDDSRVAGVPVTSRVKGTAFTYRICAATFALDNRLDSWTSLINAAFDEWQAAVTSNLLSIKEISDPCTDYHTIASDILDHYLILKMNPVFSGYTHDDLVDLVEHFIDTAIGQRVLRLRFDDLATNEIKMFNDVYGVEGYLKEQEVFAEIASAIGHRTKCWYERVGNAWVFRDNVLMCHAPSGGTAELGDGSVEQVASDDIFIRRSKFMSDPLLRPESDSMFNLCGNAADNPNSAFKSFLHEAGHALGIGGNHAGFSEDSKGGHSEPNVASVVNARSNEADCAPHPADIMALYALYQTR